MTTFNSYDETWLIDKSKYIYDDVFSNMYKQYITVFLCGGAYSKKKMPLRDRVKPLLEKKMRYSYRINVFYPEELMNELVDTHKSLDLLTCEKILAINSDYIVIICESPGSLVELGAFVNFEDTCKKVIAGIDKRHKADKSFIIEGPIKYLKKKYKDSVFYYYGSPDKAAIKIRQLIRRRHGYFPGYGNLDINTIVGLHYYIQLLLFFFKELKSSELVLMIKPLLNSMVEIDVLFQTAINLLRKENYLYISKDDGYSVYSLSAEGYKSIYKMINQSDKSIICDKIRKEILYSQLYYRPRS